ncbi:MAG TPA: exopolysaccharide biosynthesis polyprenyl glycosylphosphotransferase [Flavobacteriaceae bacterium]|nr:exopolysaccharide biosynthesis polyprenyl glycosylphosphotransferase [Flavobacteriaceae bacterium]HQU21607.1 exopolysaccharide biosynthesis polyprenyl glycosylphosphotransferase [Flavobacteriaceae bacterium]HQU66142.1 exopolysaccharide biosynthesis polyprenyl glycosylphosphotransferase [Flavobacteriaceae bacterium]
MSQTTSIHFEISERKILLRIFDIVSVLGMLYLVGIVFDFDYFKINKEHWLWSIVLALYLTIFASIFELYDLQKSSKFEVVVQNIILTASVTVLFYLLTPFYTPLLPDNRLQIVYFYIAINVALFVWRYAYIMLIATPRFHKRVLLIAHRKQVDNVVASLHKSDPNYKVMGFIHIGKKKERAELMEVLEEFPLEDVKQLLENYGISEIVVAVGPSEAITVSLYNQLIALLEQGVPIREYTQVYEEITHRVPVQHVDKDFYRYFPFSRSNQNKLYLFFHRVLDLLFSILGLLLGLLISPIIIIGNLIGNRGPIFYTQIRVGKNGKHFRIYKLRSMVKDAEKFGAQFADRKDTRVTRFGRFLRRSRFDEIPQFINVIKGDMSVIGPRPERPVFVKELSEKIPFYEVRHLVKPGVTGWAQVNAKYGSSAEDALEKLQYDLYYIKKRSLFLDISIVIKTLSTIIFFRGQ